MCPNQDDVKERCEEILCQHIIDGGQSKIKTNLIKLERKKVYKVQWITFPYAKLNQMTSSRDNRCLTMEL